MRSDMFFRQLLTDTCITTFPHMFILSYSLVSASEITANVTKCFNLLKSSGLFTYHQVEHSKIPLGPRFALSVMCGSQKRGRLLLYTRTLLKVKRLKSLYGAFQRVDRLGLLYSYPNKFPHSSPEAPRIYRCARPLPAKARTIHPDFASRSVVYNNPLGSFTCRKAGTWAILFYFLSKGRHTEDFPDTRKIQRLRPGLNPRTRVPVASIVHY
jgi:hypothetical protein